MAPYIIVPKYLSNAGKQQVSQPEWVGSVTGHNYPGGAQLAGHRVLVTKPRAGHPFIPAEHVVDLGPDDPLKPQIILPGFGFADVNELKDILFALEEKEAQRGWYKEQRRKRVNINDRVRDYADQLTRAARGRKTFGPGSIHP